jgi:hypothetical protein
LGFAQAGFHSTSKILKKCFPLSAKPFSGGIAKRRKADTLPCQGNKGFLNPLEEQFSK